jgi:DNA polymerase I
MLKKLVLLDSMALIYRAHFALVRSPRFTSSGQCTSAVFGLVNTLLDIINREQPSHLAAAFDTADPTARHEVFPQYKAHREEMPEDMSSQIPWVDRLMDAFNISVIRMPGYEADDIIGTLARQAQPQGFLTLMVTPDKDYDQLVDTDIFIWKPGRQGNESELIGVREVLEKWEVQRIDQVVDILGLMGDASDNIPGVPGIGPKTAIKLIQQFSTMENLLANVDQLKGKQRESLIQYAEQARLSKRLVTIQTDVPHQLDLENFQWRNYDADKLKQLFAELEFDTLGKRLFGNNFSSSAARVNVAKKKREAEIQATLFDEMTEQEDLHSIEQDYHLVRSAEEREDLLRRLLSASEVCFDTETTARDPRTARPLGIAFSLKPQQAFYLVCSTETDLFESVLKQFRAVFENPKIAKIGHNLKYDITVLKWHGIDVQGKLFDTMLAHMMKEPEMEHGLDYLAQLYLNYKTIKIEELIGPKGPDQGNMSDVPLEKIGPYACEDADVTLQIAEVMKPDIVAQGVERVCYEVEFPLTSVLVDMEFEGIRLDCEALARFSQQLDVEIDQLRGKIFEASGHEFNIDSPKQLGVVLYEELQVEGKPKKTATGQYSTRESELERLSGRNPIIADILEYRTATKLKRTYVDQLPQSINPKTGRLHTLYSQAWTATGRMQSINPNLQTIPIRKERGREIRAAFVPRDENYLILSADYSQIELRVMAELSGDEAMLEAFQNKIDIHAVTASKVYGLPVGLVTREMRAKAKTVNFGIIYGISAFGLQQRLNIPKSEAAELIRNYFAEYPKVREYIDATIQFARDNGYVQTQTGRKRFLRDINSRSRSVANAAERLAMNSPIQGTAADILKLAMVKVHQALKTGNFRTKMLLTVHDEIVFDLHKSEIQTVIPVIRQAMSTAFPMRVPLEVETGYGQNWLEAH